MAPTYFFDVQRGVGERVEDKLGRTFDDDDAASAHATAILDAVERETSRSVIIYVRDEDKRFVGIKALVRAG